MFFSGNLLVGSDGGFPLLWGDPFSIASLLFPLVNQMYEMKNVMKLVQYR